VAIVQIVRTSVLWHCVAFQAATDISEKNFASFVNLEDGGSVSLLIGTRVQDYTVSQATISQSEQVVSKIWEKIY
jgi:hypothetical protein